MKLTLNIEALTIYLAKQLVQFFPDDRDVMTELRSVMPEVLERLEHCFGKIHKKYFFDFERNVSLFNHLNGDHYAMLLYFVSNQAYRSDYLLLAEKVFLLNKALHGIDVFYSVGLPEVFLFVHPVGTVLGNATYSDFLVIYQNVTVGSDVAGDYPVFGEANVLYSKSSVIGRCSTGKNVCFAANSLTRNQPIPENSTVVGIYPENRIVKNTHDNAVNFFM